MNRSQFYKSLPLRPNSKTVRLLDLDALPSQMKHEPFPLSGRLRVASLSTSPTFIALSYVWGTFDDGRQSIVCNGLRVPLTSNCFNALCAIRRRYGGVTLWVDFICINQYDYVERGCQVALMREIYGAASQVVIWLGDTSAHSREGLEELRQLFSSKSPHQTADSIFGRDPSHGLKDILSRPWWRRMWVVQEAAVAKKLTFLSGCSILEMPHGSDDLSTLSEALQAARTLPGKENPNVNSNFLDQVLELVQRQLDKTGQLTAKLTHLVHTHLLRECSDPRDRVFALLGLSREQDAAINPADYALTTEEVTIRLLCNSARDIEFHSTLPAISVRSSEMPDNDAWQLERICKSLVGRNRRNRVFRASHDSVVDIKWSYIQDMPMRPEVPGIIADSISHGDLIALEELNPSQLPSEYGLFFRSRLDPRHTKRWRHNTTRKGRFAIIPKAGCEDDKVCIFMGFPLPFLLRGNEDRTFNVLGECYVEGMMWSELVHIPEMDTKFDDNFLIWGHDSHQRRRRNAFSFSSRYNPANGFIDYVRVANGLKLENIVLADWISPSSQFDMEI
jgi:hypothetical protein